MKKSVKILLITTATIIAAVFVTTPVYNIYELLKPTENQLLNF